MNLPPNNDLQRQSLVRSAFARLIQVATHLSREVFAGSDERAHYVMVKNCLDCVPLTTEEHALAICRLNNAERYAGDGEKGAARYELALLTQSIISRLRANE
jgi:hypothetical protein